MAGLTSYRPENCGLKRADEQAIAARMAEIREELIAPWADAMTLVLAAAEVLIDQEAINR